MTELRIAIVLYEHMTTLDAVGPMEVLRFLPGAQPEFVAAALRAIELARPHGAIPQHWQPLAAPVPR